MKPCFALEVTGAVSGRSAVFLKLNDVYPECEFLIQGADQLFPFRCLKDDFCPRNANCFAKLAKKTAYIFDHFTKADLVLLYFSYPDMPGSQRAGVFHRNLENPAFPRYIVFNRSAWENIKVRGVVYQWHMPDEFTL